NQCSTDPLFVAPSDVSAPAYTVYSSGNFALQAESPALGYAQTQPYLPWWTKDAGACDSSLVACPALADFLAEVLKHGTHPRPTRPHPQQITNTVRPTPRPRTARGRGAKTMPSADVR